MAAPHYIPPYGVTLAAGAISFSGKAPFNGAAMSETCRNRRIHGEKDAGRPRWRGDGGISSEFTPESLGRLYRVVGSKTKNRNGVYLAGHCATNVISTCGIDHPLARHRSAGHCHCV
jgi:hypothetical protein